MIQINQVQVHQPLNNQPPENHPSCLKKLIQRILQAVRNCFSHHKNPQQIIPRPITHVIPINPVNRPAEQEKQQGGIYGQAIGDTLGLLTEFTTRNEAKALIGNRPLEYALKNDPEFLHGPQERHRVRFNPGWTDDTDQAIAVIRALKRRQDGENQTIQQLFANELLKWRAHGLEGRQNAKCMGIGRLVHETISQADFQRDPEQAAIQAWRNPALALNNRREMHFRPAPNGAVMRTAPLGLIYYKNLDQLIEITKQVCKTTHVDPRCIASSVAVTVAIALMLRGEANMQAITDEASRISKNVLAQEIQEQIDDLPQDNSADLIRRYEQEIDEHINARNWADLRLDEPNGIGYTFKCMGSAFLTLRLAIQKEGTPQQKVRAALEELIAEGGDADTNAAVAGAFLGTYFGYGAFPESWKNIADRGVLDQTYNFIQELTPGH